MFNRILIFKNIWRFFLILSNWKPLPTTWYNFQTLTSNFCDILTFLYFIVLTLFNNYLCLYFFLIHFICLSLISITVQLFVQQVISILFSTLFFFIHEHGILLTHLIVIKCRTSFLYTIACALIFYFLISITPYSLLYLLAFFFIPINHVCLFSLHLRPSVLYRLSSPLPFS